MDKFIDLDKVYKDKNPSMYRWTPNFAKTFLKRLIREDDLNNFMEKNENLKEGDFLQAVLQELDPIIKYQGLENLPEEGGAIVVSNHPLGGLDGLALLDVIMKKRKDARFLVNDILMNFRNFGELFVPVNKMGKNNAEYSLGIDEAFDSEHIVIVFPAGMVSRRKNGVVRDLPWRKGFVTRAVKYKKNIFPTYIEGKLSNRFYNLANFRTGIGLKVNLELLLLADEMYKQKEQSIEVIIGQEVSYEILDFKRHSAEEWAGIFENFVYTLKENPDSDFEKYLAQNNL